MLLALFHLGFAFLSALMKPPEDGNGRVSLSQVRHLQPSLKHIWPHVSESVCVETEAQSKAGTSGRVRIPTQVFRPSVRAPSSPSGRLLFSWPWEVVLLDPDPCSPRASPKHAFPLSMFDLPFAGQVHSVS